jgi:quercetin dioxygenase-like cupin family protein
VRLTRPDAQPLQDALPTFRPEFILAKAGAAPGKGRAGMLYRDLIPGRLGGRYIASHISIPGGGPVADWVHYHRVALQMIFVRRGWVRVVYEDQGDPFVMNEGDLVLQPSQIRHRVLESSDRLEVIEMSAPALHETFADHKLDLPNGSRPERLFSSQQFLFHVAAEAPWISRAGIEVQATPMRGATGGLADVSVIRRGSGSEAGFEPHDGELVFGFVLEGTAALDGSALGPADAFVIPPNQPWTLVDLSCDFRLLHVTTGRLT